MKQSNLFAQTGAIISFSGLFFLATYFGKSVNFVDGILFTLGLVLGMALLVFDEKFLYKYYADAEAVAGHKELTTRSLLFIFALIPLGLFLLTSTGSAIGVGMFLGIISGLSLEVFALKNDLNGLQRRFLFQLKRIISAREHQMFSYTFIGLTLLYAFLVIFLGR